MFNIPKGANNYDDFDEAGLEEELEAILSGQEVTSNRNNSSGNNLKSSNSNQIGSNVQPPSAKQNLYDYNLDINNLNLDKGIKNLNLDDDDDFDENDPELNAQLSAIVGGEILPFYSPKIPSGNSQSNVCNQLEPTRQAPLIDTSSINQPPLNQSLINQQSNCIILDNSHFFKKDNHISLTPGQIHKPVSNNVTKDQLIKWKEEFKTLALNAKQNNDLDNARAYFNKMKDVENAIEALNNGQQINLSIINPPVLNQPTSSIKNEMQQNQPELSENEARKLYKVPEPANTMLEALNQRKTKLETSMAKEQAANNSSKVKMLSRLIKQYENAIKFNKAGKPFDYASLPELPGFGPLPLESVTKSITNKSPVNNPVNRPSPQIQQPIQKPTTNTMINKIELLNKWKDEFKKLALDAKQNNDIGNAKIYLQKMKEINLAIDALNQGHQIDMNSINSPDCFKNQINDEQDEDLEFTEEERRRVFNAPPPAETILEALEQRKAKFESTLQKEQSMNNTAKVKMLARILKQYEQAIKANKLNKVYDYDLLPVPPGFSELPKKADEKGFNKPISNNIGQQSKSQPSSQPATSSTAKIKPPFKRTISVNNKQLDYLLQRQKLFREAAVESNKRGDTTQALDYLRKSKGFDPLIDACQNGLPIDASNIPIPPQLEKDDFVIVSNMSENFNNYLDLDKEEHFRKIELELEHQIDLCNKNKEHFYKIGDVSTGSKFEKYLIDMKKDFEMLKGYKLRNEDVPKYHYETKEFSIVVCNTDVLVNECLIEIIRAIDLPCKTPVDSYVKFDFPFPKDSPQPARTHSAKNTLYPEYNQSFKFLIDRKSKSLARIFGKSLKLEIYSKGGFFRSDELIGNVNVDLNPLKTKCTVFDSFPLLNGRKEIGGKLQIKIKIREPLLSKQVEEIKEKWLVFN